MNRSTLTFLMLGLAATSAAHAEFKCDGRPLTRVDATACAKAAESLAELRRYISRTKLIYGLYIMDYGISAESVAGRTPAAEKPERVAKATQR
jgi:hypothetical protein